MASPSTSNVLFGWVWAGAAAYAVVMLFYWAYRIRMHAIDEYGPVIHEFDPYFNYRATEYLYYNGAKKFFTWFDYKVWYPLGRPVGSTIYPGMQFTAVWIKNHVLPNWSLNDICCYMPTWFGAFASAVVGMIAYECSIPINTNTNILRVVMDVFQGTLTNNPPTHLASPAFGLYSPALECGVFSMAIMAIVPAHLMRSVGGGYDNESVAMTAMTLVFYFWVRSLRNEGRFPWLFGILAGIAYFYMVAAWGGYVFVLNMVGVHAAALVALGRFTDRVYMAYSSFYIVGTLLAIQVPVVGWAPLKSLEQLAPCAVFLGYQVLQFCEAIRKRRNLSRMDAWKLRIQVSAAALLVAVVLIYIMAPSGYFGPISSRVRGLFVQHTKTGNPLVDSVAEHQPASNRAYFQYLHHICVLAPIGYGLTMVNLSDSSSFLLCWGTATYFFSHKMVRLILLTAPVGSALGGIAAGRIFAWCIRQLWNGAQMEEAVPTATPVDPKKDKKKSKQPKKQANNSKKKSSSSSLDGLYAIKQGLDTACNSSEGLIVKRTLAVLLLLVMYFMANGFTGYCFKMSHDLSHPTIVVKARTREGRVVKVDDYREAYWWLRDNTPEDARIMAWWDYGYQITAIANRTTIADGNTWNHEHIALLGKALTTNVEEGYSIARHLADYVLIWGGGGGDDLAKSPHLARIANSVYRDMCPGDPTCRSFGFVDRQGTPSPMMQRSFLFQLHSHELRPGVKADPTKFEEVYRSKYGRVRIFKLLGVSQESKDWVADPANRVCDWPGSWFCPGQYPPGLAEILSKKKDFSQLEDFNRGQDDEEYQKAYFEALNNPELAKQRAREREAEELKRTGGSGNVAQEKPDQAYLDEIYNTWEDTEATTRMWELISTNAVGELREWLEQEPSAAFIRSKDGRGPMWWAFEQRNQEIVKMLMKAGVPAGDRDRDGSSPMDLLQSAERHI